MQRRHDAVGARVQLAERLKEWVLRVDAPEPKIRDPPAPDDALALKALERALDRVHRSADPPDKLTGVQLDTGDRREEREEPCRSLAAGERGRREDGHVAAIETLVSISATRPYSKPRRHRIDRGERDQRRYESCEDGGEGQDRRERGPREELHEQ